MSPNQAHWMDHWLLTRFTKRRDEGSQVRNNNHHRGLLLSGPMPCQLGTPAQEKSMPHGLFGLYDAK